MSFDVQKHKLVHKHTKLSEADKEKLLKQHDLDPESFSKSFPKISKSDPAILHLDVKSGDIIKIDRDSKTAGKSLYYRVVIDE